jgi:hypothetical protein
MWEERRTRFCPRCNDYVEVRDSSSKDAKWRWLGEWTCNLCDGPVPLEPEERRRRIVMALFAFLPLWIMLLAGLYFGAKWLLG